MKSLAGLPLSAPLAASTTFLAAQHCDRRLLRLLRAAPGACPCSSTTATAVAATTFFSKYSH